MQTRPPSVRFLGAAGTVTGSRFTVGSPGATVLIDCGLFQGDRELRRRNWAPFPVPVYEIDAVVLSLRWPAVVPRYGEQVLL